MDDIEYLKKALEAESERSNEILNRRFSKEFMDDLYERIDIAISESIKKRFENLAEIRKTNY